MLKKLLSVLIALVSVFVTACDANYEPVGYNGNPAYIYITNPTTVSITDVASLTGNNTWTGTQNFSKNVWLGGNLTVGTLSANGILMGTNTFIQEQSGGVVAFRNAANSDYITVKNNFNFLSSLTTTSNPALFGTSVDLNAVNIINIQAGNGTSQTRNTVARIMGSNSTYNYNYLELSLPPKFNTTSISGPANNSTPVKWIKILDTDNTTAWLPMYK